MPGSRQDPPELWYRASAKNAVIFAVMWLGEAFLVLMFVKWVIHGTAAVYLLLAPWSLFGLIMVVRPNWILRMTQAFNRVLEQMAESIEKRPPPGFP